MCVWWNAVTEAFLGAGRRTRASGIRRESEFSWRHEGRTPDGFPLHRYFDSSLTTRKAAVDKNSIQEETFSIFGDPKPGSKFSSLLKKRCLRVHVCYVNTTGIVFLWDSNGDGQTWTAFLFSDEGDEVMRQQRTAHFVHKSSTSLLWVSVHTCILPGLIARGLGVGRETGPPWLLLEFALFQPLDVMAQLERGPQFQTHVFHNHVAAQEHQSFSINLLRKQRSGLVLNCPEEERKRKQS